MSEDETLYQRGDLVWVRLEAGEWRRGIATDVFVAPITGREVVVVGGQGYYADDDVIADPAITPDPQSLRA
jgi:hypothetical protein